MRSFWKIKLFVDEKYPPPSAPNTSSMSQENIQSEPKFDRQRWTNQNEFVLSVVGFTVGLGNLWRFPYLTYTNGGGSFLLCYFLMTIAVGMPYMFLELLLGQYMQSGMLGIWQICPVFKGVGWTMMILCFFFNIYYIVVLAWALLYLLHSLRRKLPWEDCGHSWNTEYCVAATCHGSKCSKFPINETVSSVLEYWERKILQMTDGIEEVGNFQSQLVGTLLLMWICCYFCIWKGIQWTGKIIYVTVLAPYVLLTFLLFRAILLPGASQGIKFFLMPDLEKLLNVEVWYEALNQALYSFGLGYGALQAFGSYNAYHTDIQKHVLLIGVIQIVTNLVTGSIVFSILGFMANMQRKAVATVARPGADLVFIIYPTVVLELPWSPFWAFVFFLLIITIGIDSQFSLLEGFITALLDEYQERLKDQRKILVFIVCVVEFGFGLFFVTQGGIYAFHLMDNYAATGWNVVMVVFLEGLAISHIYGANNFYINLEEMFGYSPSSLWKASWISAAPLMIIVILIIRMVNYKPLKYHDYVYPTWANVLGWLLCISSVMCIPVYMIYYISTLKGSLKKRLKDSIKPCYKRDLEAQRRLRSPPEEMLVAYIEKMSSQYK